MASQDIGALGPKEGTPVVIHWRWYYHVPTLPLWALLLVLLVVPKANRHRQAWLILVPPVVIIVVWRMLAGLLSFSDESGEASGLFFLSWALAWSAVWLLGHWVERRSRIATFFLALAVMVAIGLPYYWFWICDDMRQTVSTSVGYGIFAALALLPVMLAARSCRERCTPRRLLGRLLGWIAAVMCLIPLTYLLVMVVLMAFEWRAPDYLSWGPLVVMIVAASVITVILYLLHLPFLILAFKSPFYRARLERLLNIEFDQAAAPDRGESLGEQPPPCDAPDAPFAPV